MVGVFEKEPPMFIVDTHKTHFPWGRPPLELWPQTQKGFLPLDKQTIDKYDAEYSQRLREKINADEALRYEAMKPLRDFVMNNYRLVEPSQYVKTADGRLFHRMFTENVLFVRK